MHTRIFRHMSSFFIGMTSCWLDGDDDGVGMMMICISQQRYFSSISLIEMYMITCDKNADLKKKTGEEILRGL